MEDNENVVLEGTENVGEQATEQLVDGSSVAETTEQVEEKLYSQADLDKLVNERVDELLPRKLERAKAKLNREYEDKYSRVETVLNAGLGTNDLAEATNKLADFYKQKGINIPEQPKYSERDVELLARAEADDIISSGFDEVVEEVDRLADIGVANMTSREKATFQRLAEYRRNEEARKELAKIGVGDKVLQDNDFIEFSNKLNPSLSVKEKYELYSQVKPKPKVETMGSMKNNTNKDSGVKDFYTRDEALKFTKADFDKNPALFKAVEQSMSKW